MALGLLPAALAAGGPAPPAAAATQVILGKRLLVADPLPGTDPSWRRILVAARQLTPGDGTIVGDPTRHGASLQVVAIGGPLGRQRETFPLPAPGWRGFPADPSAPLVGYWYSDPWPGRYGPVRRALVAADDGRLRFAATIVGTQGPGPLPRIRLVPPAPGTAGGAVFTIAGGDTYCIAFGGAAGGHVRNVPRFTITSTLAVPTREAGCPAIPPHVVVVLTDDQRWDTVGAAHAPGGVDPVMPQVMDRLVGRGVTFANALLPTPLCTPSRVGFLTGRHAHRTGATTNTFVIRPVHEASTIATWLQAAGYRTGFFGKYMPRLATAPPPGWTEWQAFLAPGSYDYTLANNGAPVRYGATPADYATDVLARHVVDFIDGASAQPFFAVLAPYAPHSEGYDLPRPAPRHVGTFAGMPLRTGPNYDEADLGDTPWLLPIAHAAAETYFAFITFAAWDRVFRMAQLEALQAVDDAVGAIVAALERRHIADDTVVIYSSDNGLMWGEHRLWQYKLVPYEESIRVPLVIRYPRMIPEARQSAALALNLDLAPTIADLAGLPPGRPSDGRSLVPLLADQPEPWRTDVLLQGWWAPGPRAYAGVRTERWKYVEHANGEAELYDLAADPFELVNVAADPAHEALRAGLRARVVALAQ